MSTIETTVRQVLADHARLCTDAQSLASDADLYAAGMTSHASVNVMLACEDELDVEFPESMLNRETFSSIDAITRAVESLQD